MWPDSYSGWTNTVPVELEKLVLEESNFVCVLCGLPGEQLRVFDSQWMGRWTSSGQLQLSSA